MKAISSLLSNRTPNGEGYALYVACIWGSRFIAAGLSEAYISWQEGKKGNPNWKKTLSGYYKTLEAYPEAEIAKNISVVAGFLFGNYLRFDSLTTIFAAGGALITCASTCLSNQGPSSGYTLRAWSRGVCDGVIHGGLAAVFTDVAIASYPIANVILNQR